MIAVRLADYSDLGSLPHASVALAGGRLSATRLGVTNTYVGCTDKVSLGANFVIFGWEVNISTQNGIEFCYVIK